MGWTNPFRRGGPFLGPRKCDGEQPDLLTDRNERHRKFPTVDEIKGTTKTTGTGDYPPIFAGLPQTPPKP
jgi:hypothetical protein